MSLFGYGSLIFKGPPFNLESKPGYIKGFVRRFAQKSHDHRGTPENPGRGASSSLVPLARRRGRVLTSCTSPAVVTLVSEADWAEHRKDDPLGSHHVWGRVYRIPSEPAQLSDEIWAYLDHREKDGYTLRSVDVYSVDEHGNETVIESGVRPTLSPSRPRLPCSLELTP